MARKKTVKTEYGPVDQKALKTLQNSFDTMRLLHAVDAIDHMRGRIDQLRKNLLDLHGMAATIINDNHDCNHPSREEPIWELAEMVTADIVEFEEGLGRTYETLQPLETLMPED